MRDFDWLSPGILACLLLHGVVLLAWVAISRPDELSYSPSGFELREPGR